MTLQTTVALRPVPPTTAGLFLFATDPALVRAASDAGVDGFVVDWERRGKARRQAGEGTQINQDTVADLERVRACTGATVLCRVNGFGPWTAGEVEQAVAAGADEVLLPMVRDVAHVEATRDLVAGRCGLGVLVETRQGVALAPRLDDLGLSRVYVGLNDLRIDRGSDQLFAPLVDGTVELVRGQLARTPFGVAGLTLPDRGFPVPSRLLAAELDRTHVDFTFLRRSFLADTAGTDLRQAVQAIRAQLEQLARRSPAARQLDRAALTDLVLRSAARPA